MRHLNAFLLLGVFGLWGCAESPVRSQPELDPDRVIARSDDLDSRPAWLDETSPFRVEGQRVISLGETEIPVDHRLDAAYRIAENNATAAVAGAIERRVAFIFQNAEEGTALDANRVRFIGGEASRLVASSIQPGRRYWEKVAYSGSYGRRLVKYRVFASVEMPEADFRRAIVEALRRNAGRAGLSAEFAEKVNEHWNRLADSQQQ